MAEENTHPLLFDLATRVAAEMSDLLVTWTTEHLHVRGARLVRSDGLVLRMYCDRIFFDTTSLKGHRLSINGEYPSNSLGQHYSASARELPSITVAATRSPASIASDIRGRLLPDMEQCLAAAQEWVRQTNEEHFTSQAAVDRLAAAGKGEPQTYGMGRIESQSYVAVNRWSGNKPSWKAQYSHNYGVHLDIRYLPLEVAERILELVAAC